MRDEFILGHALRQQLRAEQMDPGDQFTALDASSGQILLYDEHRDLTPLDEIDDVIVHAWRLRLLPPTDGEPGGALPRDRVSSRRSHVARQCARLPRLASRRGARGSCRPALP